MRDRQGWTPLVNARTSTRYRQMTPASCECLSWNCLCGGPVKARGSARRRFRPSHTIALNSWRRFGISLKVIFRLSMAPQNRPSLSGDSGTVKQASDQHTQLARDGHGEDWGPSGAVPAWLRAVLRQARASPHCRRRPQWQLSWLALVCASTHGARRPSNGVVGTLIIENLDTARQCVVS